MYIAGRNTPSSSTPNAHRSGGGPGLGVRMHSPQQWDDPSRFQFGAAPVDDRKRIKSEKFKVLFQSANIETGFDFQTLLRIYF